MPVSKLHLSSNQSANATASPKKGSLADIPRDKVDFIEEKQRQRILDEKIKQLVPSGKPETSKTVTVAKIYKKQYTDYVKLREEFENVLLKFDGLTPELVNSLADEFTQRVKVAVEEAKRPNPGPLPENPIRYGDRKTQTERPELATMNPVEFLRAVWGPWIDAGTVYQDDITKRDDTLLSNIRSYCQRMKLVAKDVLPLPKHVRTEVVAEIADKSNIYRAMKALERRQYARNS